MKDNTLELDLNDLPTIEANGIGSAFRHVGRFDPTRYVQQIALTNLPAGTQSLSVWVTQCDTAGNAMTRERVETLGVNIDHKQRIGVVYFSIPNLQEMNIGCQIIYGNGAG